MAGESSVAGSAVKAKAELRCYRVLEAVILTLVVVAVCGVFAVPTIFFALRPTVISARDSSSDDHSVCMEPAVYTGDTCRVELQMYQECFSGSSSDSDILIRSDIDQETVEKDAELLIDGGISFLTPSAECLAAIRPFLCLYSFGLCGSTGQLHQVSSSECVDLRDDICAREWNAAVGFLGSGALPVCEELPSLSDSCTSDTSLMSGFGEPPSVGNVSLGLNNSEIARECRDDYYLSEQNLCRPVCGNYSENSVRSESITTAIVVTTLCMTIICGVIVIVLSFTVQRKFMLTFPSIYLLYLSLTTIVVAAVILIGFFDGELYCNNIDLMDSFSNPTPYCTFSGIVYYYGLVQGTFWTVFHVAALFWGIRFPFHYRQFKENGYIKYIHIATVATAVLVPLVSGLAPLKDGYVPARFPPILCAARNEDYSFYAVELPISILLPITTSLLFLIFWIILKEFVIKKLSRGKKASKVGKAQVKIMFIFIYYLLLGILALGIFSYYVAINDMLVVDVQAFFLCESFGVNSGKNCHALRSGALKYYTRLFLVVVIVQGLVTPVILIFVADCKCKKKFKEIHTVSSSTKSFKVQSTNLSSSNHRLV